MIPHDINVGDSPDWLARRLRWLVGDVRAGIPVDYAKEAAVIRLRLMTEVMK